MNKPSVVIPLAILVGGAIVAAAVYFSTKQPSTASGKGDPAAVAPVSAADHIYGNPAAPVKIVEYADFDCEYCKQFDSTMRELMSQYGASGQVAWVFRDYPITQLHPDAMSAAEAADCVAKVAGNDAYWEFTASLFDQQPVAPTDYLALAQAAGADPSAVGACEQDASTTVDAAIEADIANGTAAGALGTPYSLILAPGQPIVVVNGAWPYAALSQKVADILQSISSSGSTSASL